jgi:outer membrane protein assembly factor BamB
VVDPPEPTLPVSTGTPQGLAVSSNGDLYYADLDLQGDFPFDVGPGDDGKVWRVRFKKGEPLPPEVVIDGLAFPDGVGIVPGDLERKGKVGRKKTASRSFAGGPERLFFSPKAKKIKRKRVAELRERWRFRTGAIVTSSPAVASLRLDGKRTQVVYFTSWDGHVYAVRLSDGSEVWHFFGDPQPGAAFPAAGSPHVERVDGRDVVFVGLGETMYALEAATGAELWHFTAGTGCRDAVGEPPGLCAFDGERNQIETSPIVAEDRVYFGMDVNDSARGKGGFLAVDLRDGRMEWFFDLESGSTCVPAPGDEIRRFDAYHDEAELGLPGGFLATRAGCDFDRTTTGCGNVWSSPALDEKRGMLFFGSSNCDTDDDPGTPLPPPPMPAFDEALVALHLDGTPAWRWRPREVDNEDLAFGATPNLFTIRRGKRKIDVVGIGNKDGTYYVLDREGENRENGVAWDDVDPSQLPYWATNVVPGGPAGGIIGTPAVDTKRRSIHFATAPGFDPVEPQRPTVHALDMDTGDVLWQAGQEGEDDDAGFGPTATANGLVFVGGVIAPNLRVYDAGTGERLHQMLIGDQLLGSAIASGPVIIDGTVLVGTGIGTLTGNPESPSNITASFSSSLVALCVEGSSGCR